MSDENDRADVRRVLAGNTEAFAGIVGRWQRPLVNLAWRYCHDQGRAQELAQDAFVKAFRSLATWRGDGAFSTWLFALALNVYRSALRRTPMLVDLPAGIDPVDPLDLAEARETRERDERIRRDVAALPSKYRDALIVFYFHEMSVSDAARTIGIPEGTLKARLHRARKLLRDRLERRGTEDA